MIRMAAKKRKASGAFFPMQRKLFAVQWANQTSPVGDVAATIDGCNAHASRNLNVVIKLKSIYVDFVSQWGENYPASAVPITGTADQEPSPRCWLRQ